MKKLPVKQIIKFGKHYLEAHSADILTGFTCVGVVTTAILTHKGTLRADEYIRTNCDALASDDTKKVVKFRSMKYYIPAGVAASATIGAAIGANYINHKHIAGLAAACTLAETALSEQRDKIEELLGAKELQKIDDAVNSDTGRKLLADHVHEQIAMTGRGDTLCVDGMTGMRFTASPDWIRHCVNDFNEHLTEETYLSYGEFLDTIDIRYEDGSSYSVPDYMYNIGFNRYINGHSSLKLEFTSDINDVTGLPYLIFKPYYAPIADYEKIGF